MDEYDTPNTLPPRPDAEPDPWAAPTYVGQPSDIAPPADSGQPGYPGWPGQPGQPGYPGLPAYPGQPGYPGQSGYPGQPAYTTAPVYPPQPTQPLYPGKPTYPGQPTYPQQSPYAGQAGRPPQPAPPARPPYQSAGLVQAGPGQSAPIQSRGHRADAGRTGLPTLPASRSRTVIAALLTALGCFAASVAIAVFVLATVAINPDRPGAVLKATLGTAAGRSVATDALAAAIQKSVPGVSAAQARTDAAAIVASPALTSSLGSSKSDVSSTLQASLKQIDPAAAAAVKSPLTALPTGVLGAAGKAHDVLHSTWRLLVIIAVIAIALALLISPRRGRTLMRVGWWAIAASAVQLLIWLGLPRLLGHFKDDWSQVAAAALRADEAGLVEVFAVLAVSGVAAIVVGLLIRGAVRVAG